MTHAAEPPPAARQSWPLKILLVLTGVLVVRFVLKYAVPYFGLDPVQFGPSFWPRRVGLLAHLGAGTFAILIGVVQLWLGEKRLAMAWHRTLGKLYVAAVAVGCLGGYYLALTATEIGWVYSAGLFGLALAWTVTTAMAYVAIRRGVITQHREWMIRSYVVTLAFVFIRLGDELMARYTATDVVERQKFLAWFCWAGPLLIAEPLIQLRKLRRPPRATAA